MATEKSIEKAIAIGSRQAKATVDFRNQEIEKRKATLPVRKPKRLAAAAAAIPEPVYRVPLSIKRKVGPPAKAVLIAEGDSWFDYPRHHILRILEDHHRYDVESVAHKGDRVEDMAYGGGQLEEFTRCIEKLLRNGIMPKAILLSGGGNDIAGEEFGMLLNHAASALAGLNDSIVKGVSKRLKLAYVTIISGVTEICRQRIGHPLPIIVHGYDYPVPDGRGFLGGWAFLPGPWLEPGFRKKGFDELQERIGLAKKLIDTLNQVLKEVTSIPEFKYVRYIDLRGTLSISVAAREYQADWANELHPTEEGFEKITKKFADVIDALPQ